MNIRRYAPPVIVALLGYGVLAWIFAKIFPGALLELAFILPGLLMIALIVIESRRRTSLQLQMLQAEVTKDYRQLEALSGLYATLNIGTPLPAMRGWVASPDFLNHLTDCILSTNPKVIVELGSGVSTLISSYALKQVGDGKIYSLDHSAEYGAATTRLLEERGIADLASVLHAPLGEVTIDGSTHTWYDSSKIEELPPIDLLVVDGPPNIKGEMPRYPALPLLAAKLNPGALILIDDGAREGETRMVEHWKKEFPISKAQYFDTEKGTFKLRFAGSGHPNT